MGRTLWFNVLLPGRLIGSMPTYSKRDPLATAENRLLQRLTGITHPTVRLQRVAGCVRPLPATVFRLPHSQQIAYQNAIEIRMYGAYMS